MFRKFTRWLKQLPQAPRLQQSTVVVTIDESHAILCEACHKIVTIPGFVVALSGTGDSCPNCGEDDKAMLKLVAAWIRTEGEQREHWEGRTHKRFVKAINDGIPKRMPQQVVRFVRPSDDAA